MGTRENIRKILVLTDELGERLKQRSLSNQRYALESLAEAIEDGNTEDIAKYAECCGEADELVEKIEKSVKEHQIDAEYLRSLPKAAFVDLRAKSVEDEEVLKELLKINAGQFDLDEPEDFRIAFQLLHYFARDIRNQI